MIPGPNVALIVANSLRYGARMGVATVLGTTLGVALQLLFVVTSLAVIVELVADALSWIRWAGVAYLVWLGLRTWCEPAGDLRYTAAAPKLFWEDPVVQCGFPAAVCELRRGCDSRACSRGACLSDGAAGG
jgi:threonine/homoserine/homoserine lactone efflux protein